MEKPVRNMNKEELVAYFLIQKNQGVDFTVIRKEMELKNIDPPIIKEVIWEVDYQMLIIPKVKSNLIRSKYLYNASIVLLFGPTLLVGYLFFENGFDIDPRTFGIVPVQLIAFYAARTGLKRAQFNFDQEGL